MKKSIFRLFLATSVVLLSVPPLLYALETKEVTTIQEKLKAEEKAASQATRPKEESQAKSADQLVRFEIDNAHSSVSFRVRHLVSIVRGQFTRFSGELLLDQNNLARSSVHATIDAASINTNHEKRDEHLRSGDFFDAATYPSITFESKQIAGEHLTGNLTMHGVKKEVTLIFISHGFTPDASGKKRAGFSVTTSLNRKDFGISWNKVLDQGGTMVGDEVPVEIEIEAVAKA